jgi:hypothetical protein
MAPLRLSNFVKDSKPRTTNYNRLNFFKANSSGDFKQVSFKEIKADPNTRIICQMQSFNRQVRLNDTILDYLDFAFLRKKFSEVSFYGTKNVLPAKLKPMFIGLETFIKRALDDKSFNYMLAKIALQASDDYNEWIKVLPLIANSNSCFLRYILLQQQIQSLKGQAHLISLYEIINGRVSSEKMEEFIKDYPEWNIKDIFAEFKEKYYLLDKINSYNLDAEVIEHIAIYINAIDTR